MAGVDEQGHIPVRLMICRKGGTSYKARRCTPPPLPLRPPSYGHLLVHEELLRLVRCAAQAWIRPLFLSQSPCSVARGLLGEVFSVHATPCSSSVLLLRPGR
jgi:hypothetical protein